MDDLNPYLELALEAAEQASAFIRQESEKTLEVGYKGDTDLVTHVDLGSEKIIKELLKSKFPEHQILAEEGGAEQGKSEFLWVIDPLDGTTNFVHGYPFYAVSIALYRENLPLVGVVSHITSKEVYTATSGGGAFCNGKALKVSKTKDLGKSLLATGFPYTHDELWSRNIEHFKLLTDRTQGVRRAGAAALDFCHVARGWLDGFWELELGAWDMAAGVLIVEEAGGQVSKLNNDPFNLMEREVVASNGLIHQPLLEHLNREGDSPENRQKAL